MRASYLYSRSEYSIDLFLVPEAKFHKEETQKRNPKKKKKKRKKRQQQSQNKYELTTKPDRLNWFARKLSKWEFAWNPTKILKCFSLSSLNRNEQSLLLCTSYDI